MSQRFVFGNILSESIRGLDGQSWTCYTALDDEHTQAGIWRVENMSELVLVSAQKRPLRPLVEAALTNEARLLEAGIRRTEQRLRNLERKTDDHNGVCGSV